MNSCHTPTPELTPPKRYSRFLNTHNIKYSRTSHHCATSKTPKPVVCIPFTIRSHPIRDIGVRRVFPFFHVDPHGAHVSPTEEIGRIREALGGSPPWHASECFIGHVDPLIVANGTSGTQGGSSCTLLTSTADFLINVMTISRPLGSRYTEGVVAAQLRRLEVHIVSNPCKTGCQ